MNIQEYVKLVYPNNRSREFQDCITHTCVIELYVHGIESTQTDECTIGLWTPRSANFALLLLTGKPWFTVRLSK